MGFPICGMKPKHNQHKLHCEPPAPPKHKHHCEPPAPPRKKHHRKHGC